MGEKLRCIDADSIITGWDFSTGAVKCLAFDLNGKRIAESRQTTDLWTNDGVAELNLMQLEGQACATLRDISDQLRAQKWIDRWIAGGISATHHTAGRIDARYNQVRRAICWCDPSLAQYHGVGLKNLGGQARARSLTGGPWASRYSLSHLVKDEATLDERDWRRTYRNLPHGSLAAGYLTGNFDAASISSAASTGIMDLLHDRWRLEMLEALSNPVYRDLAARQLPRIVTDMAEPIGVINVAGVEASRRPLVYPTSDDQAAGLVGGGAVDPGQVAIILGNSAVVNSSARDIPQSGNLDVMKLNWGAFLLMRCYSNGAQFLDYVVGPNPDWAALEKAARAVPPGCGGASVLPFVHAEPSRGVYSPLVRWSPSEPAAPGVRFRAALEAIAYLIALGVREHAEAGQAISDMTISGGIARSELMGEILASVLGRSLKRLQSDEGPALGAAVTALASAEQHRRRQAGIAEPFRVSDAVAILVKYKPPVHKNEAWIEPYQAGLRGFENALRAIGGSHA